MLSTILLENALFDCIEYQQTRFVEWIIQHDYINKDCTNYLGLTPLEWCIDNNNLDALKLLTNYSFNSKFKDSQGRTLLMYASEMGFVDIIGYLLTLGLNDINALDEEGNSALVYAIVYAIVNNRSNVAKMLIYHGADKTIKSKFKKHILEYAVDNLLINNLII